jgi:hypothetical protein
MLTVPAMLGALLHFEAMRTCSITVAAAWAASATVMDPHLDLAERTGTFDHVTNSRFRLTAQRLGHVKKVTRGPSRKAATRN